MLSEEEIERLMDENEQMKTILKECYSYFFFNDQTKAKLHLTPVKFSPMTSQLAQLLGEVDQNDS